MPAVAWLQGLYYGYFALPYLLYNKSIDDTLLYYLLILTVLCACRA